VLARAWPGGPSPRRGRRRHPRGESVRGDALDTTIHGSVSCQDVLGGIGARLPEEIPPGDYAGIAEMLIAAGARLPERVGGGHPVQEVLRRHRVPDPD
jgi:hypothetical protein